ncbi:MAG TPA: iron-sulfur cluster assembly scaffold protein [Dehalococcoidia bacterium]|nr:iron-sulfur cluster assembly scaffold protein [Dehalococcoidia bacterium]
MYNERVMDHFSNPRNVGVLEEANAVGLEVNPVCGDSMRLFLRIEDNRILDARFQTAGCGAAIATSSMSTELIKGLTIEEAQALTKEDIEDALGGLPGNKIHCSMLAVDAIEAALRDYRSRQGGAASSQTR